MDNHGSSSPLSDPLKKRWFVLRHGRSEANEAGIVASQLANAENAYGLTVVGRAEVERNPLIKTCLLVTTSDVAMILSYAVQGIDPRYHRSLDPIKTGEIRPLAS